MSDSRELQVISLEDHAMTPEKVQRQVNLIQEVMKKIMKQDEHYGVIPGCKKPSLLKPGAEKLSSTFHLAPSYEVRKSELPNGHREYEVTATLTLQGTDVFIGQGVGSCSTMEGKYRYRNAEKVCPECQNAAIIKGKEEYGGGWLCFKKKGGCGAKWEDGDPIIEDQPDGKIEHDNPADYYNTVLKMAKKRAHVDAILTATAASDIFTQDIEDMPEVINVTPGDPSKDEFETQARFMRVMEKFQKSLNTQTYHKILGDFGFTNAREITDREDMEKVRLAMREAEPTNIDQQDIPY